MNAREKADGRRRANNWAPASPPPESDDEFAFGWELARQLALEAEIEQRLWKANPAGELLLGAINSSSGAADTDTVAIRLLSVIAALEHNALPSRDDLAWLLDGLKAYANQGSPPLSLDEHLGLKPGELEGPGSKV